MMDRAKAVLADETLRGIAPYLLVLGVLIAMGWNYGYARTRDVPGTPGLEPNMVYLARSTDAACLGDAVRYRPDGAWIRMRYARIAAEAGTTVTIEETGFRVNGTFWKLAEAIVEASRLSIERGTDAVRTKDVPEGHVLAVRRLGRTAEDDPAWMFEMVPEDRIRYRITHVLFTRDLSRIGERVGGDCPA